MSGFVEGATFVREGASPASVYSYKGTEGTSKTDSTEEKRADVPTGPLVSKAPWSARIELAEPVVRLLENRWRADSHGSFPCPIPGHHGRARLIDYEGDLRLGCCTGRWRSLGEARAAEAYGRDVYRPSNIEIATWTRRLAHEAGAFRPLHVLVPELAAEAPPAVHVAREGFALLVGLRWQDGPHRPVAYAVRFSAAWCGISHWHAQTGLASLIRLNVIREAGRVRRVRLYLPGEPLVAALCAEREAKP